MPALVTTRTATSASTAFAKSAGYEIVAEFYDVVSGADPIDQRPGFKAMLDRIAGNGVRTILVESPDHSPAISRCSWRGTKALGVELGAHQCAGFLHD